jgi:hypothetical protein
MPAWVELAQWAENAGWERALRGWLLGPRVARALPTCYGAGREGGVIDVWVHRSRLLRQQVAWSACWVIDKRRDRGGRGHRRKRLRSRRLGRLVGGKS